MDNQVLERLFDFFSGNNMVRFEY